MTGPASEPVAIRRPPRPELRPFVELVWASEGSGPPAGPTGRELVLPTGRMHVVFRLGDRPLRLFTDPRDREGRAVAAAVLGGVRAAPYLKDATAPAATVGLLLRPGSADLVSGAPAGGLAGRHTPLDQLWPRRDVARLCERLAEARTAACRLALVERFLLDFVPRARRLDPRMSRALARFDARARVADVVADSGLSHRHLMRTFRTALGLGPKAYCRVARFGRVLDHLRARPGASWADIAAAEGYADQAHMTREFRAFAGVSPGRYRRLAPAEPRHVPL